MSHPQSIDGDTVDCTAFLRATATKKRSPPTKPDIYHLCCYRPTAFPAHILARMTTRHLRVGSNLLLASVMTARGSLQLLDILPLDLIVVILSEYLDLKALLQFRQVNKRARHITIGMFEYQAVVKHAPDALWNTLHIDAAGRISLALLYKRLCEQRCAVCQARSGPLLFVPTFERCCGECFANNARFRMVSKKAAVEEFEDLDEIIAQVPEYAIRLGLLSQVLFDTRSMAVLAEEVEQHLSLHIADAALLRTRVDRILAEPGIAELETTVLLPFFEPIKDHAQEILSCGGCTIATSTTLVSSLVSGEEHGNLFMLRELRDHIDKCEYAYNLWEDTEYGSKETDGLTWLRSWGDVGPGLGRLRLLP